MGYQSKTWSLSDEVVAAVETARHERGESPNQFFRRILGLGFACSRCGTASVGVVKGVPVFDCCEHNKTPIGPLDTAPASRELLVELEREDG